MQVQRVTNHTGDRERWLVKHRVEARSRTGVARAGKATAGFLNYSTITARCQDPLYIVLSVLLDIPRHLRLDLFPESLCVLAQLTNSPIVHSNCPWRAPTIITSPVPGPSEIRTTINASRSTLALAFSASQKLPGLYVGLISNTVWSLGFKPFL